MTALTLALASLGPAPGLLLVLALVALGAVLARLALPLLELVRRRRNRRAATLQLVLPHLDGPWKRQ